MKPKTLILLVVAVGCGLVASYMTSRLLAERTQKETVEEKLTILVAKKNLPFGTILKNPEELFVEKTFTKGEEPTRAIKNYDQLKDRVLNKPVGAEQWVATDDLMDKDKSGLPVPSGMRAVSVKVTVDGGASGFALPNSRVDVVNVVKRGDQTYSKIILQNVLVLAVGTTSDRPEDKKAIVDTTITLALTPAQAEKVTLAQEMGAVKLILRNIADQEVVTTGGATPKGNSKESEDSNINNLTSGDQAEEQRVSAKLLQPREPSPQDAPEEQEKKPEPAPVQAPPAPPPPKTHTLRVYNGEHLTTAVFTLDENDNPINARIEKSDPDPRNAAKPQPTPAPAPAQPAPAKPPENKPERDPEPMPEPPIK